MDAVTLRRLEKARRLCYSWKLQEAYPIFRRYFDRLPFRPEPEHAEYVGWFVRTLFELGRESELEFYQRRLQELHAVMKAPFLAYPLGVIFSYSGHSEQARSIFETMVTDPSALRYHAKARMMLADYHLNRGDLDSARAQIDAIALPQTDPALNSLAEVWRSVILRRQGNFRECIERMTRLLEKLGRSKDWYGYFSAKVVLAMAYLDGGDMKRGYGECLKVRKMLVRRRFKVAELQAAALERLLREKLDASRLLALRRERSRLLASPGKTSDRNSRREELLRLLLSESALSKMEIFETLYRRPYRGGKDDALVYRQIHALRKQLERSGVSARIVRTTGAGYSLIAQEPERRTSHA